MVGYNALSNAAKITQSPPRNLLFAIEREIYN